VAQIEQQREISDDMNVLAGGREISGFYMEYWNIVEDPVFDGEEKAFRTAHLEIGRKQCFPSAFGLLFSVPP